MEVPYAAIAELVRASIGDDGRGALRGGGARSSRAAGGARRERDATSPMVARLAELATNRQMGGATTKTRTRAQEASWPACANLLAAIALAQPLVRRDRGHALGRQGEPRCRWASIVHASDPLPIFVLLVTRPDDRVLHVLEGVVRIELRGLSTEEQVRLVEARLGVRDGARQICADLLPRVGGNPFFLLEMIDALLERGALEIRETRR